MTALELQALLQSPRAPRLLQLLSEEIHAAMHLPAAGNACVFELTFLDQVRAWNADVNTPIVVYGAGEGSLDADTAADKLRAAGYIDVRIFEGGLAEWQEAGLPIEGNGKLSTSPKPEGRYPVDVDHSLIRWTGRNPFNFHCGTVKLGSGEIVLRAGELVSARFSIAMDSIVCQDIADRAMNEMLIAHLHSADFFDVADHPTAEFVTDTVDAIAEATDGTPNYLLTGIFTLRKISRPLQFSALIAASEDGQSITGQGQFEIDRTEFGSQYGSGKLFRFLGKHLVNDLVHLHVKMQAIRAES